MKVLIIDDDKLTLEAITHILEADGYEVLVAEDSFKALNIIENENINLILSDIMMPNMSGLELLNLLNYYFNKIPVILISSLFKPDIISCSKALGAKEFFVKPIDFDKLSFCVKKYIGSSI